MPVEFEIIRTEFTGIDLDTYAISVMEQAAASTPKLLDRVRNAIRARHYSRRTEVAYVTWIRRYIGFHQKAHPSTLGASDISAFLTWLATEKRVSASTQNQALAAVLFCTSAFSISRSGALIM